MVDNEIVTSTCWLLMKFFSFAILSITCRSIIAFWQSFDGLMNFLYSYKQKLYLKLKTVLKSSLNAKKKNEALKFMLIKEW